MANSQHYSIIKNHLLRLSRVNAYGVAYGRLRTTWET